MASIAAGKSQNPLFIFNKFKLFSWEAERESRLYHILCHNSRCAQRHPYISLQRVKPQPLYTPAQLNWIIILIVVMITSTVTILMGLILAV